MMLGFTRQPTLYCACACGSTAWPSGTLEPGWDGPRPPVDQPSKYLVCVILQGTHVCPWVVVGWLT
jgi:hypothetical protein